MTDERVKHMEQEIQSLQNEVDRLSGALREAHQRIDELAGSLDVSAVLRLPMSREHRDLLRTKTFRWLHFPRRVYAKLRFGNARRVPPIPD